jgi:hypothetical protein
MRLVDGFSSATLGILNPNPYTLQPTAYSLQPTAYSLQPTPHTPHPTPYTIQRYLGYKKPELKNTDRIWAPRFLNSVPEG